MKVFRLLLLLLVLSTSVDSMAEGVLKWHLKLKYHPSEIYISEYDIVFKKYVPSTAIQASSLDGTYSLQEPTILVFYVKDKKEKEHYYIVPAMPGENVIITDNNDGFYHFGGSDFYQKLNDVDLYIDELKAKSKDLYDEYTNYIKSNPSNEACAIMIPIALKDNNNRKNAALLLSPEIRNGRLKNFLNHLIKQDQEISRKDVVRTNVKNNDKKTTDGLSSAPMVIKQVPFPECNSASKITTPEKEGYTLLDTRRIAGYKCDYYLEGVRTFRFDNGDFVTFSDGSKYDRSETTPSITRETSIGDWQLTDKNGILYKNANGVCRGIYPSGVIIERCSYDKIWNNPPRITPNSKGTRLYLPDQNEPLNYVEIKNNQKSNINLSSFETYGYLKGDRLYTLSEDGVVYAFKQFVNGIPISAIESDTIVDVIIDENKDNLKHPASIKLKYSNGDFIDCILGPQHLGWKYYIQSGTIHRNGGILNIKKVNDKVVSVLTYPNGDKYAGKFKLDYSYYADDGSFSLGVLSSPELKYDNGTIIKKDGTRIQYKKGKTEQQIAAERQAQAAKVTEQYNMLCKKYGKQYVDAALQQKPIVGMPEELLKSAFNLQLVEQSTYSKLYRIIGWGWTNFGKTLSDSVHKYSIWVRNGRVTNVRYWGE